MLKRKPEGMTILDGHELMHAIDEMMVNVKKGELINVLDAWIERFRRPIASDGDGIFSSDVVFLTIGFTSLAQRLIHHSICFDLSSMVLAVPAF
jgi:hypothetical protein